MKICVMEEYVQKIVVRCFGNEVTCDLSRAVDCIMVWHAGCMTDMWRAVLYSGPDVPV